MADNIETRDSTTYTEDEILATGCGTEIADDAVQHQYLPALLAESGEGDQRVALYRCGPVYAIKTNAGAVWEDEPEYSELLEQVTA